MATVYNLEPQPTAKVLLTTTSGDLLLELFAKQTPLASRSFIQHCLDGYYTGTIFHRLIPGFIIQGGDPSGTGHGGECALPDGRTTFEDEFHSRLKFNRRGLLGMANTGGQDKNGSQFFLTLGDTSELQKRNTMFGRIEGETIYNLMKMGEADVEDVEGSERPMYPTRITGCEVLVNPFEGMEKREIARGLATTTEGDKKKGKKGKKNKTLLSFGGDDGEEEVVVVKEKFNPKLVRAEEEGKEKEKEEKDVNSKISRIVVAEKSTHSSRAAERDVPKAIRKRPTRSPSPPRRVVPNKELQLPLPKDEEPSRSSSASPEPAPISKMTTLLDKTNAQIADLKASMKRNVNIGSATETKKKSALEQMIPETAMRGRKRKHGAREETQTMNFLNAFRTKLEKAVPETKSSESPMRDTETGEKQPTPANGDTNEQQPPTDDNGEEAELCDLHFIVNCQSCQSWDQHGGADVEDKDGDSEAWMSHALRFEKDRLGKDLEWKKNNEESLMVIDPLEKAKDIKEEQRAKKLARMGKGSVGTQWGKDRERDRGKV